MLICSIRHVIVIGRKLSTGVIVIKNILHCNVIDSMTMSTGVMVIMIVLML